MKSRFARFAADYGMIFVLLILCLYYSWATNGEQQPAGVEAAEQVAKMIQPGETVLIAGRNSPDDILFVEALKARTGGAAETVVGEPAEMRVALEKCAAKGKPLGVIALTPSVAAWSVFENIAAKFPALGSPRIVTPRSYRWPNFLKASNLLNVANQIAVIAIIAIGMTVVILTAGIDLSVGSMVALSAVSVALAIRSHGAEQAGAVTMVLCCLLAIVISGCIGALSGILVTAFEIPAFIATLAMMLIARGQARLWAESQSVYQLPESFVWLGRGAQIGGIPNAVILMLTLYAIAYVVMSRTVVGRYVYAVGGNPEAARLSGVPVKTVIVLAYAISGMMAGLGGVVLASQLKSGAATYGEMYELYVIAAVVVGGTSLSGGEGKILGTLIGALIIAVIQNGMNLTDVGSDKQMVVLGAVILGAVLLDKLKKRLSGA